jgi:hypothetical protein
MKSIRKILIFVSVPVVALGITGAVIATRPDTPPETKKSETTVPSAEDLPTAVEGSTDTVATNTEQPAVQPTETTVEPQESLQDEIKRRVVEDATSRGIENPDYQAFCLNQTIMNSGGAYQDEAKARSYLDTYLKVTTQSGVNYRITYEGGCKVYSYAI